MTNREIKLKIKRFLMTEVKSPLTLKLSIDDFGIHVVDIINTENSLNIEFFVARPGFLIGKMGLTLIALQNHIQESFPNKTIKINIKEYDPFHSEFNVVKNYQIYDEILKVVEEKESEKVVLLDKINAIFLNLK